MLGALIVWPHRENLPKTMLECFCSLFVTKVAVSLPALRFLSNAHQTCKQEPAHGLHTSTTTQSRYCLALHCKELLYMCQSHGWASE